MPPKTHYARSGDVNIAYQVLGAGPRDLVMVFGYVSNIEVIWEEPMLARFLTRLASRAPDFFRIPHEGVSEVGFHVEI